MSIKQHVSHYDQYYPKSMHATKIPSQKSLFKCAEKTSLKLAKKKIYVMYVLFMHFSEKCRSSVLKVDYGYTWSVLKSVLL